MKRKHKTLLAEFFIVKGLLFCFAMKYSWVSVAFFTKA